MIEEQKDDKQTLSGNSTKPIVSGSLPLCCMDCQRRYDAFGLDVVLPKEQWKMIHPDEQGVLCTQCIVNRAEKMGAIVAFMTIDFGGIAPTSL